MQSRPLTIALCGSAILAVAMGIGRFAFTPLFPLMHDDGLLGIADGGVLASVHFVGYLMGALFAGRTGRWPSATLYGSLCLIALSTAAMGLSGSFSVWLAARWTAGFCSALVLVTVSAVFVKRLAELRRPELQGMVFAGVGAGILIAGLMTLQFSVLGMSSRWAWLLFGLISLIVAAAVYAQVGPAALGEAQPVRTDAASTGPLEWRLMLPYGAMGVGYIIPATYLPIMARNIVDAPLIYGLGWPVFGLAAALSTLLASRFQSKYSDRRVWIVSQAIMAAGLAAPALFAGIGAIVVSATCVGGTFMVITMTGMREAHRLAGPKQAQRLIAALTVAFAAGQIVGPAAAGWIYDLSGSFSLPLLLASLLLIGSLAPLPQMRRDA